MKIESSKVEKLYITEIENLDPITVILEDLGPKRGKIIIECYGQSWSAYWDGMGNRSITEFFCSCDKHYLAKNLSSINSWIDDTDALTVLARKEICKKRRAREIDCWIEARDLYNSADCLDDGAWYNYDFMKEVFGEDWVSDLTIPHKANPDYEYLCRIIKTVQSALQYSEEIQKGQI